MRTEISDKDDLDGFFSWKQLIVEEMKLRGDTWENLVGTTLTTKGMNKKFYVGHGIEEGEPFTLWTKDRVYFPVCYDGAESVGSVPRNPCDEVTFHIGG